jgi:enolase-phosphatase E1
VTFRLAAAGVGVVLLDIEGTTTPIEFVHRTLFGFARAEVRGYLAARLQSGHPVDAETAATFNGLHAEHTVDAAAGHSPPPWHGDASATLDSAVSYVEWLITQDRKSRWLKDLQGRIWEEGYRRGVLKGEVYPDVPVALRRWTDAGISAGIFSSGSVLAQKLLFAHSTAGDLTPFLSWHFDTAVGSKTEVDSYKRIAALLASPPSGVLFVSDVMKELDAARAAGFQTLLCARPPAELLSRDGAYPTVSTFEEIVP